MRLCGFSDCKIPTTGPEDPLVIPGLGRLSFCAVGLTPSMPVSSSAFPASPPQPSWRIRAMMSRKLRSRHRACASLTICTLPQRSHSMRRNHDGNAVNGSPMASAPEGNGSVPSLRQCRAGTGVGSCFAGKGPPPPSVRGDGDQVACSRLPILPGGTGPAAWRGYLKRRTVASHRWRFVGAGRHDCTAVAALLACPGVRCCRRRDAAHVLCRWRTAQPSAANRPETEGLPEPGPPSRAAHASTRSMPGDAAGALAIRSGEQHGLNVIVVMDQQSLDRSGRPMQAGSEIFRQRLPMREDLPLEGDGPALGERGDGALDIAVIPGEQRDQRRSRLSHERRQVPGQRGAVRELLALVNDRDRLSRGWLNQAAAFSRTRTASSPASHR